MRIEFTQHIIKPGESIPVSDDYSTWVVSAQVEEGGKIRVVMAAYIEAEEV